ncbi:MAG: hypothetical protein ABIG85_04455 [Chloroflexota bacterium]
MTIQPDRRGLRLGVLATCLALVTAACGSTASPSPAPTSSSPASPGASASAAPSAVALLGPAGGNFHSPDEWVSLPEVVHSAEIVRRTAEAFCG